MEPENEKQLKVLIEALTHSGSNVLDEDAFKQVKKICKSNQNYISKAYSFVLQQLKKQNSQIRLIAFQICKELFSRSALFRQLLVNDLQLIFELIAEINAGKKLPPPKSSADKLKVLAISTLKNWVESYGEEQKKLKVAYNYLKNCKRVDFTTFVIGTSSDQVIENEQQRLQKAVNEEKIKKVVHDFNSNESEIQATITSLSNCLSLLLPTLEDFFIPEDNSQGGEPIPHTNAHVKPSEDEMNESEYTANNNNLREFGLPLNYSISLQLNLDDKIKVVETQENVAVIENAKDSVKLINNKFLPMVKKWIKIYSKCSDEVNDDFKKIIDLKNDLEKILKKYYSLNIEKEQNNKNEEENSSDDDFVEVQKEGYEDSVNFSEEDLIELCKKKSVEEKHQLSIAGSKEKSNSNNSFKEPDINAPSTSGMSASKSKESDRKTKPLSAAPKLPFDIDLYHWEDDHLTAPTLISTKIDVDNFWVSCGSDDIHDTPNPEREAALRTRIIEFTSTFEPVKWACRAPLPNGTLCPRKDRCKCPFHGKIVARDESGKCQNPEDEKEEQSVKKLPDWQDPELLKDLKVATGIDLKIPEKKGKRKRANKNNLTHKKMKTSSAALRIMETKKLPGLVDVVKKQNNAYTRLSKKIFNRSSLKRVSSVLNRLDRNKC